jgi:hypothetical protein
MGPERLIQSRLEGHGPPNKSLQRNEFMNILEGILCAGQNETAVADERAVQKKGRHPFWPQAVRVEPEAVLGAIRDRGRGSVKRRSGYTQGRY